MAKTLHRHAQQALRDRADEFRALEREYNEKCREKEQLKEAVVSLRAEATRKADLQDVSEEQAPPPLTHPWTCTSGRGL